jgi:hypothetical protein
VSWFSRSQAIISRWSRLRDHGTSYSCVVEAEGSAVSTTTTINYGFGAGVLFPSTGIVLNNTHRDDPWHTPSSFSKFYRTSQESFIFFHDTFIVAKVWQEELLSSFLFKPSKTPSTWTVKMQEIL